MSYRIKLDQKSGPPGEAQLLSGMDRFLFMVQEHRAKVLAGLVALLAVAVAIGGAVWYSHRQADEAFEINRQAMQLYIDRPADKQAQADENLKKAISLFQQVVEQHPRSPVTPMALYHLGNALVQANNLAGAIEAYKQYIADHGSNKVLLGLVYQRLGFVHLLNGDREQAVKAFSAILDVPGALNKDQAIFELGKLEESQSRPEGALARYQDLAKSYPTSPFASEAAVRIKALEVKKAPDAGAQGSVPLPVPPQTEPAK
ncbi:MAG: tetratricopeptide repeat protein [Nitrospirae bacterium]|nr:MAG: tetratricopeptide repeat protein [Nitrospirota bacterium]